jgi:hypothetical protein
MMKSTKLALSIAGLLVLGSLQISPAFAGATNSGDNQAATPGENSATTTAPVDNGNTNATSPSDGNSNSDMSKSTTKSSKSKKSKTKKPMAPTPANPDGSSSGSN